MRCFQYLSHRTELRAMGTFGLHVAAALLATTGFSSLAARAEGFRVGVDPYMPITVPLAVRSPYLGAFLSGGNDKNLAGVGATFWTGSPLVRSFIIQ